ncbi:Guanosine nucleotide diphosphate dissociation inhibitor [Nymphaea thermarum]|nr:Guanosine nucleotide diphosphate dissociation inhibitor [Nymphaea thermarum]
MDTDSEALKSPILGPLEKHRAEETFVYVEDYGENRPQTHDPEQTSLKWQQKSSLSLMATICPDQPDINKHPLALKKMFCVEEYSKEAPSNCFMREREPFSSPSLPLRFAFC